MYPPTFGVSFSLHRCSELGLDKQAVLKAALIELGFRRYRLMSYWNIHEQTPGVFDFSELDWQMDLIARYGGSVSLAIGKRQPRWPECHIPDWALELPTENWYAALYRYITQVVSRYEGHPALESWQLENEALLKSFGDCKDRDYNRTRLQKELDLVKQIDPMHPVIMTLSDSWGLPWRRPRPDVYAMSLYRTTANKKGKINMSHRGAWFYKIRAGYINLFTRRHVFIHELQAEPWTLEGITVVGLEEQLKTMNADILADNMDFALQTGLRPIDLWGLEWWYWLRQTHDIDDVWWAAKQVTT